MKQDILNYLREDPRFRERANKNKGLANLLAKKYNIEIPKDKRDDFISDVLGADRYWRQILAEPENEYLRGSDYGTKDIVEQEKEISLGYVTGFNEDIKALKKL